MRQVLAIIPPVP